MVASQWLSQHHQRNGVDINVDTALRSLRRSWPARVLIGAQVAVAAGALAFVLGPTAHDDLLARARSGEAAQVVDELERVGALTRSAREELALGHALLSLGREDEALRSMAIAARAGVVDEGTRKLALAHLGDDDPARSVMILRAWPNDTIVTDLAAVAASGAWLPRQRALALLDERGALAHVDLEDFAIRDLRDGDSCSRRKSGLEMLRRHGRTMAALDALSEAARNDSGCLQRLVPAIESTLRVRLGLPPPERPLPDEPARRRR